jgi:hypothetical protein
MRSRLILLLAVALGSASCRPATVAVRAPAEADTLRMLRDVQFLASDALEGRGTGTPGNDSAAAYIAAHYGSLRLETFGGGYLQPFVARVAADPHRTRIDSLATQNVVGLLRGTDPVLRNQYVVIGAHFDHLGRSAASALDPDAADAIRNGADDNASGTAAVMELARLLTRQPTRRSIIFISFSGEELGLLGSSWFVNNPPIALDSVVAMLNFDMVGRLRDDRLIVYGVETAAEMRGVLASANARLAADSLRINGVGDGFGPSDHASFYGKGLPVLHFFTDLHEDYHRASDDADKINAGGMGRVVRLAERVVREIGDRPDRLTFQQATSPRPVAARQGSGVYLGTIPDMGAADVEGMRLTGVRAGSPGDSAGLKAGDVIVRFGDHEVKDIYTYTDAMNAYKPGDEVMVEVLRAGERVSVRVRLGQRGG